MNKENEIEISWLISFFKKNILIFIIYLVFSLVIGLAYSYYYGKSYIINATINIAPQEFLNNIQSAQTKSKDPNAPNLRLLNYSWEELFEDKRIKVKNRSMFFYMNLAPEQIIKMPTNYTIDFTSSSADTIMEDFENTLEDFISELKVSLIMSYNLLIDKLEQKNSEIVANNDAMSDLTKIYNEKLNTLIKNNGSQLEAQEYYNIIRTIQSIKIDSINFENDIYNLENNLLFLNNFLFDIKNNNIKFYDILFSEITYKTSLFKYLIFFSVIGLFLAFITSLIRTINKHEF